MLRRLQIENYGLIARADVEFAPGITVFSGETGSGKTMLVGALAFALGGRAGPDVIASSARRAIATLTFDPDASLLERLRLDGYELDDGESAAIVREINDAGRSAARLNGRPATAAYLRDVGDAIAEIIGQHEAHRLLAPAYHRELLDRFAGEPALAMRARLTQAHARAKSAAQALDELTENERRARERHDDASVALSEIEAARLQPGEDERLNERRRFLENAERISSSLSAAHQALTNDERGAVESLGAAAAALAAVAPFDAELRTLAERAALLQSDCIELAAEASRALEGAEFDPAELDAINARLEAIDRLKRRYGGDLGAIQAHADEARRTVDQYENRDRAIARHRAELAGAQRDVEEAANELTSVRKRAASELAARVQPQFEDVALTGGRFDVAFEQLSAIGINGAEDVEFLFAANAGEPARPLTRVASGGELSRVLLAVVVALAQTRTAQGALVFDEIDSGIGGATATAVGARIGKLARSDQIVCVTHLAQLARWADEHYVLEKFEKRDGAAIVVRRIGDKKERESEIARMLSGESHDAALRHARTLLKK
ncbi:MAG: DNA repair protein RecN [Candidatus Eremiobacteraeota bacterium]|nr:DNA repair protein RecN [Candidatus Eremiobacteraeota bacterium]